MLWFSKSHTYLVSIDEQTVMYALFNTYLGGDMEGDYKLIRLLLQLEVTYRIVITEANREAIRAEKKQKQATHLVVASKSLAASKKDSKETSKVGSKAVS